MKYSDCNMCGKQNWDNLGNKCNGMDLFMCMSCGNTTPEPWIRLHRSNPFYHKTYKVMIDFTEHAPGDLCGETLQFSGSLKEVRQRVPQAIDGLTDDDIDKITIYEDCHGEVIELSPDEALDLILV